MTGQDLRTLLLRCPGSTVNGAEVKLNCPKCSDRTRNLQLNTTREVFHCWRCHFKGRAKTLFRFLGVPFVGGGGPVAPIPCNVRNPATEAGGTPIPYTPFTRGIDTPTAKKAYRFAQKKLGTHPVPMWWGVGTGKVARRLVIPVLHDGDYATYQARAIYKWQRIKYFSGKRPDFRPTSECFYKVGGTGKTIVLVEGPFDCIPAQTIMQVPVWGIFGTNLSEWQQNHLAINAESVILWMDPDTPGVKAAQKIAAKLETMGLPTLIAESPTDPKLATTKPSVRPAF